MKARRTVPWIEAGAIVVCAGIVASWISAVIPLQLSELVLASIIEVYAAAIATLVAIATVTIINSDLLTGEGAGATHLVSSGALCSNQTSYCCK